MAKWKLQDRIAEIISQPVRIPNASVGKLYEANLDFEKLGWKDLIFYEFEGLNDAGLGFDETTHQIKGTPVVSGDRTLTFKFKLQGQSETDTPHVKDIPLIINPDPKSLWKNLESSKDDLFYKADEVTKFDRLGDKHILVSSKRGRSHANVGSFREDDFAYAALYDGWNIIAIADGAGSAKMSRKGSDIACNGILEYFRQENIEKNLNHFDDLIASYNDKPSEDAENKLNLFVYENLGNAVLAVHKKLQDFASSQNIQLKDLSSTLIFTVFKKYPTGYALLSFGVGDCPMAILNKELTEVTLLNWIDVGEFGGGTRFITMPEIFHNEKFSTRFGFRQVQDFSYFMLMSDGIYDPKFVVESKLSEINTWQNFLEDLGGKNDEGLKVELNPLNKNITEEFSRWMDFWSVGNHDDRTLAIVF
ncbi:MAG: protein phosphatase 2C domain-containing protein [Opitutaceae bacterium]|nr:protein phosphatase 2C domain-containing protein [Cytophagales bacterium]